MADIKRGMERKGRGFGGDIHACTLFFSFFFLFSFSLSLLSSSSFFCFYSFRIVYKPGVLKEVGFVLSLFAHFSFHFLFLHISAQIHIKGQV